MDLIFIIHSLFIIMRITLFLIFDHHRCNFLWILCRILLSCGKSYAGFKFFTEKWNRKILKPYHSVEWTKLADTYFFIGSETEFCTEKHKWYSRFKTLFSLVDEYLLFFLFLLIFVLDFAFFLLAVKSFYYFDS
jgi:hypothetical protein